MGEKEFFEPSFVKIKWIVFNIIEEHKIGVKLERSNQTQYSPLFWERRQSNTVWDVVLIYLRTLPATSMTNKGSLTHFYKTDLYFFFKLTETGCRIRDSTPFEGPNNGSCLDGHTKKYDWLWRATDVEYTRKLDFGSRLYRTICICSSENETCFHNFRLYCK